MAFASARGIDTQAKPRSAVIATLSGVFGPKEKFWRKAEGPSPLSAARAFHHAGEEPEHVGQVPHQLHVLGGVVAQGGTRQADEARLLGAGGAM